jgi:hypothetical protein
MKLWSFVWTDNWLICLPECHVCTQLWTALLIFRSELSDIWINCYQIIKGLLYLKIHFPPHGKHFMRIAKNGQLYLFMEVIVDEYIYGQNPEFMMLQHMVYM